MKTEGASHRACGVDRQSHVAASELAATGWGVRVRVSGHRILIVAAGLPGCGLTSSLRKTLRSTQMTRRYVIDLVSRNLRAALPSSTSSSPQQSPTESSWKSLWMATPSMMMYKCLPRPAAEPWEAAVVSSRQQQLSLGTGSHGGNCVKATLTRSGIGVPLDSPCRRSVAGREDHSARADDDRTHEALAVGGGDVGECASDE